jgi:hypothetical protein
LAAWARAVRATIITMDATANIIPAEFLPLLDFSFIPDRQRRIRNPVSSLVIMTNTQKLKQLPQMATIALLCLAVLMLAWPRMKASFRFLPVDLAIERYYKEREIPSRRMLTLMDFSRQAIEYHDHYRYHDGLSFLYYLRAIDINTPALERREAYRLAETESIESLQRAPAQPETWLRVATVRMILHDEPETIVEPWKMSIFTGRTHSTLLVPRVDIGLSQLAFMDNESRAMLRDQLLLAWDLKPRELLQVLKWADPLLDKTRGLAGATDPVALQEMRDRLEKIH